MSQELKIETATVTVPIGPFVTSDGTAVTAFTLSAGDTLLSKNGGAYASKNHTASAVHMSQGMFGMLLNSTDIGTLGRLDVKIARTGGGVGKLPVWKELEIVTSSYWDIKGIADFGPAQASTVAGVAQASATDTIIGKFPISVVNVVQSLSQVVGVAQASEVAVIKSYFPVSVVAAVIGGAQASLLAVVSGNVDDIETNYAQASAVAAVAGKFPISVVNVVQSLSQVAGVAQASVVARVAQASVVAGVAQASVIAGVAQASQVAVTNSYFPVSVVATITDGAQATTVAGVAQASTVAGVAQASTVTGVAQASSLAAIGPAKNVALPDFMFFMVKSTDHITPLTAVSPVGFIKKGSGSYASLTNAVAEVSSYGQYVVDITQTEMNDDIISLVFTAAGADQVGLVMITT